MPDPTERDKPRVLMVGPTPPPTGGVATQVALLLSSSLKTEYSLLHFDPEMPSVRSGARPPIPQRLLASFRMMARYLGALHSKRIQVVHLHASSFPGVYEKALMAILAKLLRRKAVLHLHGGAFQDSWRKSRAKWAISWCLAVPDSVVVLSEGWAKITQAIAPNATIDVVPTSIRAGRYGPSLPADGDAVQVLFLGWVIRAKGVFDLADAVARIRAEVPPFEVHVVGDGVDREALQRTIMELSLAGRIRVHGWQDEEKKIRFLQTADLFVLPTYAEGLPVALLEAMAAGLPVITTPVGAIPEVVTPGVHGELVQPGDVPALASALEKLCGDAELRQRYGRAGQTKVRSEFDIEKGAARVASIYQRLLGDS